MEPLKLWQLPHRTVTQVLVEHCKSMVQIRKVRSCAYFGDFAVLFSMRCSMWGSHCTCMPEHAKIEDPSSLMHIKHPSTMPTLPVTQPCLCYSTRQAMFLPSLVFIRQLATQPST